jgi:hypothetical protein
MVWILEACVGLARVAWHPKYIKQAPFNQPRPTSLASCVVHRPLAPVWDELPTELLLEDGRRSERQKSGGIRWSGHGRQMDCPGHLQPGTRSSWRWTWKQGSANRSSGRRRAPPAAPPKSWYNIATDRNSHARSLFPLVRRPDLKKRTAFNRFPGCLNSVPLELNGIRVSGPAD